MKLFQVGALCGGIVVSLGLFTGCAKPVSTPTGSTPPSGEKVVAATGDQESGGKSAQAHDHSGWWCAEHGVPEEECGLCNSKLAADFQKKGDWCKEHDRPDSQCFKCHPEKEALFAARYEAKYGSKAPKRTED
jgi:cobalt-zinc-cadmium efflux system membrane fusion protein